MPKGIIIVASDQHLGYENSNRKDFTNFLKYISNKDDLQSLILLGDLIDMWRRDVSGLFLEFSDVVGQLSNISASKKMDVYIVPGNHDYHLIRLQDHGYEFKFYAQLPDPSISKTAFEVDGIRYIFKHGWEFDLAQQPLIMEAMCHNMSDEAGHARSSIYNILQVAKDYFDKELKEIIDYHNEQGHGYVENLLTPPEDRLKQDNILTDVEKRAYSSVKPGERLIFGHTHRPFVSTDHKIVNTGCWVKDAKVSNTFVEIEGESIKLFQFENADHITDITAEHYLDLTK